MDDIELGELHGDGSAGNVLAEAHRTERRIEHDQPETSLTGQQSKLQIENASLNTQQQHLMAKPKLPQRFHRRRRIMPPQRQPFSRATDLLQMEEGRLATEQLRPEGPSPERAFSPALDVQLATEPPERKVRDCGKPKMNCLLIHRRVGQAQKALSQCCHHGI